MRERQTKIPPGGVVPSEERPVPKKGQRWQERERKQTMVYDTVHTSPTTTNNIITVDQLDESFLKVNMPIAVKAINNITYKDVLIVNIGEGKNIEHSNAASGSIDNSLDAKATKSKATSTKK